MKEKTVAKQRPRPSEQKKNLPLSPPDNLQEQLQSLLKQQKYRQALEEIQKARRNQPDITFKPSEAEIWLLRGKQEWQKQDPRSAENSLRRAIQLGLAGEPHYWLARCLLQRNRLEESLELFRSAFAQNSLPREYSICYAKLLLMKGDSRTVQQLLQQESQKFTPEQQQWLRGILALKEQQPDKALAAFGKVKHPLTPGDRPDLWTIYALQSSGDWQGAAEKLGLDPEAKSSSAVPKYSEHPLLQRLALLQQLKTGQPSLEKMRPALRDPQLQDLVHILSLMELLEKNNAHEAGHFLLKLQGNTTKQFPELETLRPSLLTLAGQQSFDQKKMECAELFWTPLLQRQPFNPQLAVNLIKVLDANESYPEQRRLLTNLIQWLKKDARQNPAAWPPEKLNLTLAHAHCRLADTWMSLNRYRAALGDINQAERICPQSPEVLGRLGLIAFMEDKHTEAVTLLNQALEGGCRHGEVYFCLIETWQDLGKQEEAREVRRRFGKYFDDRPSEVETVELPPWIEALSSPNYPLFSHLVQNAKNTDPALQACEIFVGASWGIPNSSGRVSLDQEEAQSGWQALLADLPPPERTQTLQAIAISVLHFAKREKGIAALANKYIQELGRLAAQHPEARVAHLVVLCLKEREPQKIQTPLRSYLDTMPQPGGALAQLQLQLRYFSRTPVQRAILSSHIEASLGREPQNPLLLLAKATTYPPGSPKYEELRQEGFEIARRLQDARALQAFRQEQAFLKGQELRELLPPLDAFGNFDETAMDEDDILRILVSKLFGDSIPPDELNRILPDLKRMMQQGAEEEEEEEDEPFGFGFPFGGGAARSKKSRSRKRK